jgi:hypothetical protein
VVWRVAQSLVVGRRAKKAIPRHGVLELVAPSGKCIKEGNKSWPLLRVSDRFMVIHQVSRRDRVQTHNSSQHLPSSLQGLHHTQTHLPTSSPSLEIISNIRNEATETCTSPNSSSPPASSASRSPSKEQSSGSTSPKDMASSPPSTGAKMSSCTFPRSRYVSSRVYRNIRPAKDRKNRAMASRHCRKVRRFSSRLQMGPRVRRLSTWFPCS